MRIRGGSIEVAACCHRARLPVEATAPSVMALLVLVGRQLHGLQGTVWGKERRMTLRQLDTRCQQLERQLLRALPHLPRPIPLVRGGSETGFSASQPDELPLPEALPTLLSRFREGIARLLAATEVKAGGRPPVSDAMLFGMEGLIAIWRQHHPLPGSLSAKAGGLLCFVEEALAIPQKANLVPADMQLPRSTLRAELANLVQKAQERPRAA